MNRVRRALTTIAFVPAVLCFGVAALHACFLDQLTAAVRWLSGYLAERGL